MAKMLVALVFLYVGVVFGVVTLDQLFIVQTGSNYPASCDDQLATLNNWVTECANSIKVAQDVMGFYNEDSPRGLRVRKAMLAWFKIAPKITKGTGTGANNIIVILEQLSGYFNGIAGTGRAYLFCDSEWLIQQEATEQAYDAQNQPIVDDNGNAVAINAVPSYQSQLGAGDVPWWSGTFTNPPVYGYAFAPVDDDGGNYCQDEEHAGLTSTIVGHKSADPDAPEQYESMIICPSSFDNAQPADLAAGVATILAGALTGQLTGKGVTPASTTIQQALPKSYTLLHEAMHVIAGNYDAKANPAGVLAGKDERYDLAQVLELGRVNSPRAKLNPESYMYFFAQLNYMFGRQGSNGVTTNIDFENPFAAQLCVNGCGDTAAVVS